MSTSVYLTTIGLVLGTILLIYAMRYLGMARQAAARGATEESYRGVAATAGAALADTATQLSGIKAELSSLGARIGAIEKILTDVG